MLHQCWNPTLETMQRGQLQALQSQRLRHTVRTVFENVKLYRDKMREADVTPDDILSIEDLRKLPFTKKSDLRNSYPYGLFAVPQQDIIRLHASSGTTGKQTVVGYTSRDIDTWSDCMARCLIMAGQNFHSKVQVSYGYGLFTGGLGVHYGTERIGATVIPTSVGNTQRQATLLKDFGTTVLCCTPSYAMYIAETLEEMKISKEELSLTTGIFGAEPWSVGMRNTLEEKLGIKAYDIYGLSEIMGPSVSQECYYQDGLHIWEDCFIAEIIDCETLEVLPEGSVGELVLTTINKEGMPLLRYRTGDISSLQSTPCQCGRTHIRMSKPAGRSDDMLIVRGVNVFPSQIESVLLDMGEVSPHYEIVVEREGQLDKMTVKIELSDKMLLGKPEESILKNKMKKQIESVLGIACDIELEMPKTIKRSEGKAKRVIDKRHALKERIL